MIQAQFLMPGLWYANNKHLPPGAIGANYTDQRIIAREDRLPIPLVALREPSTKTTLTLMHKNPTGESFLGDQTMKPVCSDRLRFSSLGVINKTKHLGVSFLFPGSEGETTYGSKGETTFMGKSHRAWVPRYHRLRRGHKGRYKLLLKLNRSSSFNTALYSALSLGWSILDPAVYPVSLPRVYQEEINLLDHYAQRFNGIMGLPFSVTIPKGKIIDRNLQIGWVGKQALDAYHLIRAGHHERRSSILEKGRAMINFWVENAPYPSNSGLFRTWFETQPKPHWHHSPIYLRAASDGARGVLRAFNVDQKAHHPQPAWLKFCKNFGQWLYRHQNPDGSFPRKFSFNTGKVISQSKSATLVPIPFLVNLYRVTGQHRYLKMALNAGRFGQQTFVRNAHFYGGTLDNPNVQDKEAGSLAFAAFLSLYDVTNESRWLKAATAAANYTATWIFSWNVPMDANDPHSDFPRNRRIIGMSTIATGHSGVDMYLASRSFDYYQLWLYTHNKLYKKIATVLAYDTKQTMDYDGSLHYRVLGLQDEATTIAVYRGRSVGAWLPWITANQLEPLSDLQNAFGTMKLKTILAMPIKRQERDIKLFRKMGGFVRVHHRSR